MNWDAKSNPETKKTTLAHWRKLGKFRKNHPAIGVGTSTNNCNSIFIYKNLTKGTLQIKPIVLTFLLARKNLMSPFFQMELN
jgi:alpha-amylase